MSRAWEAVAGLLPNCLAFFTHAELLLAVLPTKPSTSAWGNPPSNPTHPTSITFILVIIISSGKAFSNPVDYSDPSFTHSYTMYLPLQQLVTGILVTCTILIVLFTCKNKYCQITILHILGFLGGSEGKECACNAGNPGSRSAWLSTPVFLPGESQGQRSLVGYSPWGRRVGHDWATNFHHWS